MAPITTTLTCETTSIRPMSVVEFKGLSFLIFDSPSQGNLPVYLKEFRKHGVTDIARVCHPTYSTEPLAKAGINVHDMSFDDGTAPPPSVVTKWLDLVQYRLLKNDTGSNAKIGIHCLAGLGRAPVLVAIALIEQGMSPLDSVVFIRERRKGAFNNKQIQFLEKYRRQTSSLCTIC